MVSKKKIPKTTKWFSDPSRFQIGLTETTTLPPTEGSVRKRLQDRADIRRALCQNEEFRADVVWMQEVFPITFWDPKFQQKLETIKQGYFKEIHAAMDRINKKARRVNTIFSFQLGRLLISDEFDKASNSMCKKWGLDLYEGPLWLKWLIYNWNPQIEKFPPREPKGIIFPLRAYTVNVMRGPTEFSEKVNIELSPWFSMKDVKKLIKNCQHWRGASKTKNNRPALSGHDREIILQVFQSLGLPKKHGEKIQKVRSCAAEIKKRNIKISFSTLQNLQDDWLRGQNHPRRKYQTAATQKAQKQSSLPS